MTFETRPIRPTFGAEVKGVRIGEDLGSDAASELRRLFAENELLLFRGQECSEEDLVSFSRIFGDLEIHMRREYLSPDNPEILFISNMVENGRQIGILSDNEVGWHFDQIYLPKPAVGSLLYGVILPKNGGSTSFADMTAAYEALPQDIKDRIEGKRALQSYDAFNSAYSVPSNDLQKKTGTDIYHPLVRTHPVTGRKALYVCPGMSVGIEGMEKDEATELLEFLFEWSVKPEFTYEHEWQLGDALLWDNACTMHRREPFDQNEKRLMKRTTILPPAELAVPY